jgi:hypothetical protein
MRIGGLVLGFGLVSCLCPSASSGADLLSENVPFSDFELSLLLPPSPKVTERATAGDGTQTNYRWRDPGQSFGYGLEVASLNGVGHPWGGVVWGAALSGADYDITPGSYSVDGGGSFTNTSPDKLHYRTLGVTVLGGYEYGINGDDHPGEGISGFLLILPELSGGAAWTDDEQQSAGGTYTRERHTGSYYQVGLRVGGYLTEEDWIYGVVVEALIGRAKAHLSFPGSTSSDLVLKQQGVGFGLTAGYRF